MHGNRRIRQLALGPVLIVILMSSAAFSWGSEVSPALKLRAVYNAPGGSMAPLWVAQEAGLLSKQGLEVRINYLAATTAVQAMVGGSEDIGIVGNQGIDANLEGADTVYVAATIPIFIFHLYGQPGINSIADLKGKVVAVSQASSSTDYAARIILSRAGLVPDKDVKILFSGTIPAVLAAVKSGNAAAGILSAPTTIQAREIGLKPVVNITEMKIPFLFSGVLTPRKFARENGEAVTRFLRAYIEAISVIRKEKESTLKVLAKYLKTDNREALEAVYNEYVDSFPRVPLMTAAQGKAVLDVAKSPRAKQAKPEDFFDNSFVQKIQASGFIDSLYAK